MNNELIKPLQFFLVSAGICFLALAGDIIGGEYEIVKSPMGNTAVLLNKKTGDVPFLVNVMKERTKKEKEKEERKK